MKTLFSQVVLVIICGLCFATPAYADKVPEYMLQKDYENCMGGETGAQDVQRAQYCSCVRNKMREWDEDVYTDMLLEAAKTQEIPGAIKELAQSCIQNVVR